ncbi:MAG: hypothetical protein WC604_03675, partial [Candidatus Gracilibacteria bacterium]
MEKRMEKRDSLDRLGDWANDVFSMQKNVWMRVATALYLAAFLAHACNGGKNEVPTDLIEITLSDLDTNRRIHCLRTAFHDKATGTTSIEAIKNCKDMNLRDLEDLTAVVEARRAVLRGRGLPRDLVGWWQECDNKGVEKECTMSTLVNGDVL